MLPVERLTEDGDEAPESARPPQRILTATEAVSSENGNLSQPCPSKQHQVAPTKIVAFPWPSLWPPSPVLVPSSPPLSSG